MHTVYESCFILMWLQSITFYPSELLLGNLRNYTASPLAATKPTHYEQINILPTF